VPHSSGGAREALNQPRAVFLALALIDVSDCLFGLIGSFARSTQGFLGVDIAPTAPVWPCGLRRWIASTAPVDRAFCAGVPASGGPAGAEE
jgi:hypothetical protein